MQQQHELTELDKALLRVIPFDQWVTIADIGLGLRGKKAVYPHDRVRLQKLVERGLIQESTQRINGYRAAKVYRQI